MIKILIGMKQKKIQIFFKKKSSLDEANFENVIYFANKKQKKKTKILSGLYPPVAKDRQREWVIITGRTLSK